MALWRDIKLRQLQRITLKWHNLIFKKFLAQQLSTTVRTFLALAAIRDWYLSQLDVNNVFLNGDLNEKVYMEIAQGYEIKEDYVDKSKLVCKLQKSLYGLKQASRQWNIKFTEILLQEGFIQSKNDYSLFTKHVEGGFVTILV